MPDVKPAMLTLAEACTYTGFSERHLRRCYRDGRLNVRQVGSRLRFMRADLDRFLGIA
jgi:excisionase family DNA binding protein